MASEALSLIKQLQGGTASLRKVADGVAKADVTKAFADALEDVIATLSSVNSDLCVGSAAFVQDYDLLISGPIAKYMAISNQLGGEIAEQAVLVQQAFEAQRAFISVAAESKPPSQTVLMELLKPTSEKLSAVQDYREKRRSSKFFNHLSANSEFIPVVAWVTMSPKPAPYLKEMIGSATFYTNRVLKEYREKEPIHVEWTKSLIKIIQELEEYVKKHHLTGVTWNKQGKDAVAAAPAAPAAPAGGPPGPPPPPPPVVEAPSGPAPPGTGDGAGRSALFADLNRGGDVTKGLKRVTDNMKTHKNPDLRKAAPKPVASGPTPYKAPAASKPVAAPKTAVKKPSRMELVQKKWDVEYFENNQNVRLDDVNMKQTVYVYKCANSTITVPSKVNSITVDGCKKVGVVFESVLGSIDIVNCQSIQVQVLGKAAIINIDKTDGCMVYLSKDSKDAQIISAKSSEMNVLVPNDDGEFTEFPLPEQYRSVYNGKNMKTDCVDSLG